MTAPSTARLATHVIAFFTGLLSLCAAIPTSAAPPPAYFDSALRRFKAEPPAGWAYTLTTSRDGQTTVERFDPRQGKDTQWTLLQRDGKAPTDDQQNQYRRYKATVAPTGVRATFERRDIDSANPQLIRETPSEAEFLCRFREGVEDSLLTRLALTLVVDKQAPAISAFTFRLIQPFAPAFGVKMEKLEVTMTFDRPQGENPPLPRTASSRFKGRVLFFKSVEENLEIAYSDFTPP